MRPIDRWLLALALVVTDAVFFFAPLTGIFVAYLILARPAWFRWWVADLYERPGEEP